MRQTPILLPLLALATLLANGCATMADADAPPIPANAVQATRTADNGDVISEYRVAGQLRMVRVQPVRGPAYYLMDSNDDGRLDRAHGEVSPVYYKLYGW
ncbi:DUF2782 domain-containing protein [Cognatiluteimonas telluris]|jgi:hypothetical protein|uniref:DUF2782 domain-containing protein n=1 Tax=Cognatiluteimonas telluris TaxID=1104775 RepID=UPI0014098419|nr:DUF2782 domain-containing protein [Lysobacter telluris]